jgi:O-antigen/teichoic acid export membrane protein
LFAIRELYYRVPCNEAVLQRITSLFRSLAIYGLGDAATSIVSLLLLPVYTAYLSPEDYGVIALLLVIEAVTKVLFRWGVDTAFMRLYYDCADQAARQRLASTLFFFLLVVNGTLLVAGIAAARWLSLWQFDTPEYGTLVALVMANMFVTGFYFMPFQVLRIRDESKQFIALSFVRSAGTLVMRLVLVVGWGMGVMGVVVADVIVTAVFTALLSRWFVPLIRPVFSPAILRDALGFGLPRIPHSIAHHVMGLADRYLLKWFGTLADVGVYSVGATFGLALKFFLSAFEFAWTPFFLGVMREPDAQRIYSTVSTYVVAVLVLLVAGISVIAPDLVRIATQPEFHGAAVVTPWIALGVMFQGLYLVGSIGLIITKRTTRYPLATGFAALVSLLANALLIPRYGMLGAAWANAIAYATLAAVTIGFSWRLYPIPYEWSRLLRIAAAAGMAYWVASRLLPSSMPPVIGILARGSATVGVYAAALFLTGFFHAGEIKALKDIRRRAVKRQAPPVTDTDQVEMAGEIVATAHEPGERLEEVLRPPVNQDSPASRR